MNERREDEKNVEEEVAKLHRAVAQADQAISRWAPGKFRDATTAFYSRSSRPERALKMCGTGTSRAQ